MGGYDKLMHMKFNDCLATAFLFLTLAAHAQTTAFTYQGQLFSSNSPAAGVFDLRFQIYNANNSAVAGPLTNAPVGVTNGLFTVTLDFGASVFNGSTRSLEIGVRSFNTTTNVNTNAYVVLSPRQTLTSAPYAIQSLNASNAAVLTGPLPATNLVGTIPNSLLSPNVAVLTNNVIFSGSVSAANFIGSGSGLVNVPGTSLVGIITGNGSGLSSVPATSLTGTLPDVRLSANVALQSNPSLNFAGTVSAANFAGSGHGLTNVPGAVPWVTVTANTQAQPNIGYLCNNGVAPVAITLPSSPNIGDLYRVAGLGAGGWKIMQNANQTIAAGNLTDSIGESWTAYDSSRAWSAVASSADGTKLVATVNGGQIYTSANSGVTWTAQASSTNWSSVASSADGTSLVAGVGNNASSVGYIYTSANSGIGSWSPHDSARQWVSVASSADGTKLVAAAYGTAGSGNPGVYTSTSSGSSWALSKAVQYCSSVASSADGTKLVATVYGGQNLDFNQFRQQLVAVCQQFELDGSRVVRRWEPVACGGRWRVALHFLQLGHELGGGEFRSHSGMDGPGLLGGWFAAGGGGQHRRRLHLDRLRCHLGATLWPANDGGLDGRSLLGGRQQDRVGGQWQPDLCLLPKQLRRPARRVI